jgi:hypothetical protein
VALDFLPTDANFEKFGIANITLPVPLTATDGWAVGIWFRLRASLSDAIDRNGVNQLLQLATVSNGAWNTPSTINMWWATSVNGGNIDGVESVNGKFYVTPSGWVAGDNGNAANWSDVAFSNDDVDRLLILQLVNVAGSWKLRLYVTAKGSSATLVNESPVVTPSAILVDHIRVGNRIPAQSNRDWRDVAGQLFLLKRPLSVAEITQLAAGTATISNVALAADILGHWPLEAAGVTQSDASGRGNDLVQLGAAATYAGFDFISAGAAALAATNTRQGHAAQAATLVTANSLAPLQARHPHITTAANFGAAFALGGANAAHTQSAQSASLGGVATSLTRPFPHGDVDLAASSVSGASSTAPVVTLWGDPEANDNIPTSWHNLCVQLDGVLGKTPQISIANVHQWRSGANVDLGLPQRGWRPWWRIAGGASTSWQRFDAYSVNGNSISFANDAAFTTSSIEVAFFPVWNLDETHALFDHIYASSSGSEPPAAIAYRSTRPALPLGTHNQTAAVTSPDGIAVPILPMRSARISSSALFAPDGLPKRSAVILFNMHAQEASGGWTADRLLRTLVSTSADAVWLRDRFVFDCYAVNHSGMAGGASRGVVESWDGISNLSDPNRAWPAQISPPNGPLPEVNDVVAAIATNSAGKADVLLSYHSDALTSVDYGLAYYFSGWDSLVAVKAFKDALLAAPAVATLEAVSDNMADVGPGLYKEQGFGRHVLGAALSWVQETTFATSDYLADSQTLATRHIAALRQVTQDGLLPVAVASANTVHALHSQTALLITTATVAPQAARHAHRSTAAALVVNVLLVPRRCVHTLSTQAASFITGNIVLPVASSHAHRSSLAPMVGGRILTPLAARHSQITSTAGFAVAGQILSASVLHSQSAAQSNLYAASQVLPIAGRHMQRAAQVNLIVPASGNPDHGRKRPIKSERRVLKLRFS